jgi:O-antigen/teichoic acid export membrane protein
VYKIHATAALVLSVAPSAVMPAAAFLNAADDERQLRALYLRGTKYAVAFCLPVALAALLYARAILVTWVGIEYESLAGATRLFLVYPVLVAIHVIGVTMLVGLGRMREMVILSPASVALNLVISLALVSRLGLNGVIWGTLIGYIVIWVPYVRLLLTSFKVGVKEWFRSAILPNIPGAALQLAVGLATLRYVDRLEQLWQVGVVIAASCALSLGCFLFLVLGSDERRSLTVSALRRAPVS